MVGYRCYVLDAEDHIVQAHDLDCETDADAEAAAAGLLARDPYHQSVEVWHAARRVAKLAREAARHLRSARQMPPSGWPLGSAI
jgi:hypothetical protein